MVKRLNILEIEHQKFLLELGKAYKTYHILTMDSPIQYYITRWKDLNFKKRKKYHMNIQHWLMMFIEA